AAGETTRTWLLAALHADVTEPLLAACGALGVVAELGVRVHRCVSRGTVWRSCPERGWMDPCISRGDSPHHGSLGYYHGGEVAGQILGRGRWRFSSILAAVSVVRFVWS